MLSGRKSRNTKQTISRGSGTWHSHNVARPPPPSRPRHSSPQKGTPCPSSSFSFFLPPNPGSHLCVSGFTWSRCFTWVESYGSWPLASGFLHLLWPCGSSTSPRVAILIPLMAESRSPVRMNHAVCICSSKKPIQAAEWQWGRN